MRKRSPWIAGRFIVLMAALGLLFGAFLDPARGQDPKPPDEETLRKRWTELGERAQWVDYDVFQLSATGFALQAEAEALRKSLRSLWKDLESDHSDPFDAATALDSFHETIQLWTGRRAALPMDLTNVSMNAPFLSKMRLRGTAYRWEHPHASGSTMQVVSENASAAIPLPLPGQPQSTTMSVASVGGPMPDNTQGIIAGFPWQLLGGTNLSRKLTTADALEVLLRQAQKTSSHGPAELAHLPTIAAVASPAAQGDSQVWMLHDPATLPIPRMALHIDLHPISEGRVQVKVWGWSVRNVKFAEPGKGDDLAVQLPSGYRIAQTTDGKNTANGSSDEPERWPETWFEVFVPPREHEGLLDRRAANDPGDPTLVDQLRKSMPLGRPHLRVIWPRAAAILVLIGGFTWLIVKKVRRLPLRAAAIGLVVLLGAVVGLLAIDVGPPTTIWCLQRSPTVGNSWIVCDRPDGELIRGEWTLSPNAVDPLPALYSRKRNKMRLLVPEFARSPAAWKYVATEEMQTSEHGEWRAYARFH